MTVITHECAVSGCGRARRARGYCTTHYYRWLRNGDPGSAEIGPRHTCSVPGCKRAHMARGYCNTHYSRWRLTGDAGDAEIGPPGGVREVRECSVSGCENPHAARGYCNTHYQRWLRTADGAARQSLAGGPPRKETVGYTAAHRRVRVANGLASGHPCRECGDPAAEWAYTNDDPDELTDVMGRYSLDVARYVPMCTPCHRRFDHRENQRRGLR